MANKIWRFIGAVIIAFIATIFINCITLLLFAGIAHVIHNMHNIGFVEFIVCTGILGFAGTLVLCIAIAIGVGLIFTSRKSIFIAVVVILIFLNSLLKDWVLLWENLPWGTYSSQAIAMIKEDAGSFYKIGAIITLIANFVCYSIYSILCFIDPEENKK